MRKAESKLSGISSPAFSRAQWFRLLPLIIVLTITGSVGAEEDGYDKDSTLAEASDFLGDGAEGIADVIEKIFEDLGAPNAYIKGQEISGAFGIGARYGNGDLLMKNGAQTKVHWSGPSIGFDAGGNASKVFVLVYRLPNTDAIFKRFPALEGSFYFVGGVGANYHQRDDIILAPIRVGAGLRTGVNIGYMHYRRKKSWNPF